MTYIFIILFAKKMFTWTSQLKPEFVIMFFECYGNGMIYSS